MKTLLIMRHAKSSWKKATLPDHERPLNKRGQLAAPRMGKRLRESELVPQAILSSTAVRASATAAAVAEAAGFEGEVQLKPQLYAAPPEAYLDALRQLPADVNTALVIGHNPGLEELVELLTGKAEHLPTAAIARVNLPIAAWDALDDEVECVLADLWRPREAKTE